MYYSIDCYLDSTNLLIYSKLLSVALSTMEYGKS